ncbi:hypothetical protein [Polaribacter ponticola]|uniref:Uncharacterized protein n=1 Tax=Polaribacter ponticola TaxID=2978475 RepID=A0ABT5SAF6_9FLAO|nr:hypothetical protein [Polaribacter sp. MSW5]MDD7915104.1 hypothetical protein [Polaribacter sp. MSW5]
MPPEPIKIFKTSPLKIALAKVPLLVTICKPVPFIVIPGNAG